MWSLIFQRRRRSTGFLITAYRRSFRSSCAHTGLSEDQLKKVEEAAKETAVLKSANMSLGINLLLKLLKDAAKVLAPAGFDMEIVERHHNQKLDAPSGTALALADSINEEMNRGI